MSVLLTSSSFAPSDLCSDDVRVTYVRQPSRSRRVYTVYEVEEPLKVVVDAAPVVKYRVTTTTTTTRKVVRSSPPKYKIVL
ncbi:unnamed protein product [Adineta ricciae]|uniref:Uncharacterized protein n=1 Tax=Adineta ricciae TaxID=249248 RepID=A0A814QRS0_ADIRI|nr:unnamed protein product [Adineta ricciae]CAF1523126.1 unnamed protein product [Adineta ricciae]